MNKPTTEFNFHIPIALFDGTGKKLCMLFTGTEYHDNEREIGTLEIIDEGSFLVRYISYFAVRFRETMNAERILKNGKGIVVPQTEEQLELAKVLHLLSDISISRKIDAKRLEPGYSDQSEVEILAALKTEFTLEYSTTRLEALIMSLRKIHLFSGWQQNEIYYELNRRIPTMTNEELELIEAIKHGAVSALYCISEQSREALFNTPAGCRLLREFTRGFRVAECNINSRILIKSLLQKLSNNYNEHLFDCFLAIYDSQIALLDSLNREKNDVKRADELVAVLQDFVKDVQLQLPVEADLRYQQKIKEYQSAIDQAKSREFILNPEYLM